MEINGKQQQRGVLLMSFHFQPVSFSLEASPCRSPCPLATDVCQKRGVELFCGSAFCSAVSFSSFFLSQFFFFFFYLELGCQEGWKKKKKKKKWKINREAQSDPIVSMRFFLLRHLRETHLSGGAGMRPNCSQSLLILPVQSPHWAGEGRGGGRQTPSFDLLSALASFESWLVFIKPFRSAVRGHSLTN